MEGVFPFPREEAVSLALTGRLAYPSIMFSEVRYGSFAASIYRVLIDPLIIPLRKRIAKICSDRGARRVIDIASATGAQCRLLARAGIHATGVDLSEPMIDSAKRRGGRNVDYVCASAYELPFESGSFDASVLSLALHEHTEEERGMILAEARRVASPYGFLIIADYTPPARPALDPSWLAIRLIERTAGKDHRAGFVDFVIRGGLNGLMERYGLLPYERVDSRFRTIGIAIFEMPD